jgi:hypothetical protein
MLGCWLIFPLLLYQPELLTISYIVSSEYIGEIVSSAESEVYARLYDYHNLTYIFSVTAEMSIDALSFGSRARFINHNSINPNCIARCLMVSLSDVSALMVTFQNKELIHAGRWRVESWNLFAEKHFCGRGTLLRLQVQLRF